MMNEPLGLPKGSVRAMLVLLIAVSTIAGIFMEVAQSDKLVTLLMSVTALYLGGRMDWSKVKQGE